MMRRAAPLPAPLTESFVGRYKVNYRLDRVLAPRAEFMHEPENCLFKS